MPVNSSKWYAEAMLNDLHPSAHAQDRQSLLFGKIQERILGDVSLGRIATKDRQVVPAGQDNSVDGHFLAQRPCSNGRIWHRHRRETTSDNESYPSLIETIATLNVSRIDDNT